MSFYLSQKSLYLIFCSLTQRPRGFEKIQNLLVPSSVCFRQVCVGELFLDWFNQQLGCNEIAHNSSHDIATTELLQQVLHFQFFDAVHKSNGPIDKVDCLLSVRSEKPDKSTPIFGV
jgi:hypothetical protein